MKGHHRTTRLVALCAAALGSATVLAADPPTPTDVAEAKMHHDLCRGGWPSTGNLDQDFALRLRQHQLRGIEMARNEIARGADPQMKALAQAHIDDETRDVAQLEAWLTARNVAFTDWPMRAGWRWDALDTNRDGLLDASEVGPTYPWHRRFADVDANRDGRISRAEFNALHPYQLRYYGYDLNNDGMLDATEVTATNPWYGSFAAADSNRDGRLSWAEFQAGYPAPLRFGAVDLNRDGVLDATEVTATHWWYPQFALADADHDGRVSRSEADVYLKAHRRMDRDDDGDVDAKDCWERTHDDGTPTAAHMPPDFAGMDKNGDGYLTMGELPQSDWARGHFTAVDSNNDGKISRAELDAHHAAMGGKHDH